jgi:hypothetical protein
MTAIFTIGDFQSAQPSGSSTRIESVTGYWTEGTTAADNTSNITVVEVGFGGTATYTLTGPENGPGLDGLEPIFSARKCALRNQFIRTGTCLAWRAGEPYRLSLQRLGDGHGYRENHHIGA